MLTRFKKRSIIVVHNNKKKGEHPHGPRRTIMELNTRLHYSE